MKCMLPSSAAPQWQIGVSLIFATYKSFLRPVWPVMVLRNIRMSLLFQCTNPSLFRASRSGQIHLSVFAWVDSLHLLLCWSLPHFVIPFLCISWLIPICGLGPKFFCSFVASFANLSAISFPLCPSCPGHQNRQTWIIPCNLFKVVFNRDMMFDVSRGFLRAASTACESVKNFARRGRSPSPSKWF